MLTSYSHTQIHSTHTAHTQHTPQYPHMYTWMPTTQNTHTHITPYTSYVQTHGTRKTHICASDMLHKHLYTSHINTTHIHKHTKTCMKYVRIQIHNILYMCTIHSITYNIQKFTNTYSPHMHYTHAHRDTQHIRVTW